MSTTAEAPSRAARARHILAVLAKHGIAAAGGGTAEQVRTACEELGTTFIKIGQLLSARADLVPDEYRSELAKLQDAVPPVGFDAIERVFLEEFADPPEALFETFDPEPMASASIGQVYRATLPGGARVVVKVQKPGVRALVETDLEVLAKLIATSKNVFSPIEEYDLGDLLEEFGDTLRGELDYQREARNVETFRKIFEDDREFVLPEVIWECTTSRILTMTEVEGVKVDDAPALTPKRRDMVAQRIARFVLEPALIHGIFHADPHPGNLMVQKTGRVAAIDFGMVEHVSDGTRRHAVDLFLALERRDPERLVERLIALAPPRSPADRAALAQRAARLMQRYMNESLDHIEIGDALAELLDIVRTHRLRAPASVTILFKAVAMCEGLVLSIAPEQSFTDFLRPIAERVAAARFSPETMVKRARESALDAAELSLELPRHALQVLTEAEQGNLRVWARVEELDDMFFRFEKIVERANSTMIAAACIVGLTLLLVYWHPSGWQAIAGWLFWITVAIAILVTGRIGWSTIFKR